MFRNYLTVAMRTLMRHKLYAFINVFGLALGIACCLLMALFVQFEWSHDWFHEQRDRIFRVVAREARPSGAVDHRVLFPHSIVEALKTEIPAVVQATAFIRSEAKIAFGERAFREQVGLASVDFLRMFSFPLLAGDPATALARPDGMVVGEGLARKLFGDLDADYGNAIGQSLTFPDRGLTFVVTGVLAPVPAVSSLQFNVLIPVDHYRNFGISFIDEGYASIYALLGDGQDIREMEAALVPFAEKNLRERIENLRNWEGIQDTVDAFVLRLQPLTDVYWNASVRNYYESSGNLTSVTILLGLAGLVLLIACSNFTTLSIAGSAGRAVEVGVRKVLGADRRRVMQQFWCEAVLMSVLSLLLGLALAELFLPVFNGLVQRELNIAYLTDGSFPLMLLAIAVAVGVIAGSYPSLTLSRFQPVDTLKGHVRIGGRSRLVRALVVLQYTASIALMICTGVMVQQQVFMQSRDLGYDQEQVVVVRASGEEVARRYKQEILKDTRIAGATISDRAFTTGSTGIGCQLPDGRTIFARLLCVDSDYLPTLRIPVLEGRNFSEAHPSDRDQAILVNETLVRKFGLEDPVGKPLPGHRHHGMNDPTIIGVVRDFHIDSLRRRIQPLILEIRYHLDFGQIDS